MTWLVSVLALVGAALALPGTVLPGAPPAPPGVIAPPPADPIRAAIDARTQGDLPGALRLYGVALGQRSISPRTRAALHVAVGQVHERLGDLNLASAAYARARTSGTPVAMWATWHEARVDHDRGRHAAAASRCRAYRGSWPDGPHADECLVLIGDASVAAGDRAAAIGAYQQYLELHPGSPREETLRLGIALAVATTDPARAVPLLRGLAVDHAYHLTGVAAEAKLAELQARGLDAALPTSGEWAAKVALERKRCGYEDDAWQRWQALVARADSDPALAAWIDAQAERFAWGTKQYEALAARYAAAYARAPGAKLAWDRYKALRRAGLWNEAADQLQQGIRAHGEAGPFRGVRDDLARALLLAGRYAEAREAWTALGRTGGQLGKEARWLAAYAAFRLPDLPDALTRLDAVIQGGGDEALAARYYKARALDQLGRAAEADAVRAALVAEAPRSWYAALLRSDPAVAADGWNVRAGRWHGPVPPPLVPAPHPGTGGVAVARPRTTAAPSPSSPDWSRLAWGAVPAAPSALPASLPRPAPTEAWERRPDSYRPGFLFDPAEGDAALARIAATHGGTLKWVGGAADLARVGCYEDAAPVVARMFDAIEAARDGDPAWAALRSVDLDLATSRHVAYFARDDHHAAKLSWGATRLAADDAQRRVAQQRAFPTAEIDAIYRHGLAFDLDPFLVLGLMRQESVYRQWALSPVGAIGLMQVMPRTGARVAALIGDRRYSPEDLEDPSINVRYGTWYLSRLMARFDGAWPLAVASYNGGPHNVGSWLRPWGAGIRMDDFVEQIPYPETRDYVKKVTGWYTTYVELYGPPGARVRVPPAPGRDDASVIDF